MVPALPTSGSPPAVCSLPNLDLQLRHPPELLTRSQRLESRTHLFPPQNGLFLPHGHPQGITRPSTQLTVRAVGGKPDRGPAHISVTSGRPGELLRSQLPRKCPLTTTVTTAIPAGPAGPRSAGWSLRELLASREPRGCSQPGPRCPAPLEGRWATGSPVVGDPGPPQREQAEGPGPAACRLCIDAPRPPSGRFSRC